MPRILVADDNSNIQKMVALALKDEGIDVVAVGNGDAAMRKIPDLRPDLVLADIFMPVRNGYEVCEFVKSDSRYMSTPVVLLVGAFDPLDEQETQRVRADGVLKKPFVPPDPLINMVKALLAKSNGQKPAPAPTAAPPIKTIPPPPAPAPASRVQQAHAEDLLQHVGDVSSSAQGMPPVFLEPAGHTEFQTADSQDSDVVTAPRDPNLGEPFWATAEEGETVQPEEKSETETEPKDMVDMHSFGQEELPAEREYDQPFRPDSALLSGTDFGVAETIVSQKVTPTPEPTQEPSASSLAPETPPELFKFDPTLTFPTATQNAPLEEEFTQADRATLAEPTSVEPPAAVMDANAEMPLTAEKPLDAYEPAGPVEMGLPPLTNREAVITAATEAARQAFSEMNRSYASEPSAETFDRPAGEMGQKDSPSASASSVTPTSPTPEMIDAVVNRLLEHMQPQIMEVVNREVLRPAIEAIVRKEMKKS